jgi:hypothetical protein
MQKHPAALGPEFREVIAAWLVCLMVTAGCLTLLAATAAEREGRSAALINPERIEIAMASVTASRALT